MAFLLGYDQYNSLAICNKLHTKMRRNMRAQRRHWDKPESIRIRKEKAKLELALREKEDVEDRWIVATKCLEKIHERLQRKRQEVKQTICQLAHEEDVLEKKTLELQKNKREYQEEERFLTHKQAQLRTEKLVFERRATAAERQTKRRKDTLREKILECIDREQEISEKTAEQEENLRQIHNRERVLQEKAVELQKHEDELEQKSHEVEQKKEELEKNICELQELRTKKLELLEKDLMWGNLDKRLADDTEFRDLKAMVHGLQRDFVRMAANMQDASSGSSDTSSVHTLESWIHVGAPKPCCFHPDAHFKVFTSDGPVLAPASMLHQGARVQSASGEVVELVHPPEQHQVESVIELKAGEASLVVSPDHRVLIPGNKTVKAEELSEGDVVILDGVPARLSSCARKTGKTLVIRLGFKPDLPVAVSVRFASAVSFSLKIDVVWCSIVCTYLNLRGDPVLNLLLHS